MRPCAWTITSKSDRPAGRHAGARLLDESQKPSRQFPYLIGVPPLDCFFRDQLLPDAQGNGSGENEAHRGFLIDPSRRYQRNVGKRRLQSPYVMLPPTARRETLLQSPTWLSTPKPPRWSHGGGQHHDVLVHGEIHDRQIERVRG